MTTSTVYNEVIVRSIRDMKLLARFMDVSDVSYNILEDWNSYEKTGKDVVYHGTILTVSLSTVNDSDRIKKTIEGERIVLEINTYSDNLFVTLNPNKYDNQYFDCALVLKKNDHEPKKPIKRIKAKKGIK